MLAEHGQEVRARPAFARRDRSAGSSRAGCRASAGCGTAGARPRARGAVRDRRRPRGEGRRPDGQERDRLRPAAAVRRFARHARRARAGDAAVPAAAARSSRWFATDDGDALYRPVGALCGRAAARRCCSKARRPTSTRRRAASTPLDAPPALPDGRAPRPHLGRAGARARASARALDGRRALVRGARRRHDARRGRRPPTRSTQARAVAARARRLDAARGGRRARRRRLRPSAAERRRHAPHQGRVRSRPVASTPDGCRCDARGSAATSTTTTLNACVCVRAVPAALPDVPRHRPRDRVAARPHRGDARGRVATARRSTTRSAPRWRSASRAAGCEAACPSAVPFGQLMEQTRAALPPPRSRVRRVAEWLAYSRRAARGTGCCSRSRGCCWVAQRLRLVPKRLGLPRALAAPARRAGRRRARRLAVHRLRDGRVAARHAPRRRRGSCARPAHASRGPARGGDCCGALHLHAGRETRGAAGSRRACVASMPGRRADRRRQRGLRRGDEGVRHAARHRRRAHGSARGCATSPNGAPRPACRALRPTGRTRRRAGPVPPAARAEGARRGAHGARRRVRPRRDRRRRVCAAARAARTRCCNRSCRAQILERKVDALREAAGRSTTRSWRRPIPAA